MTFMSRPRPGIPDSGGTGQFCQNFRTQLTEVSLCSAVSIFLRIETRSSNHSSRRATRSRRLSHAGRTSDLPSSTFTSTHWWPSRHSRKGTPASVTTRHRRSLQCKFCHWLARVGQALLSKRLTPLQVPLPSGTGWCGTRNTSRVNQAG